MPMPSVMNVLGASGSSSIVRTVLVVLRTVLVELYTYSSRAVVVLLEVY